MPKVKAEKKSRMHADVQRQGINFRHDLGQHILKNPLVIVSMVSNAQQVAFNTMAYLGDVFHQNCLAYFAPTLRPNNCQAPYLPSQHKMHSVINRL